MAYEKGVGVDLDAQEALRLYNSLLDSEYKEVASERVNKMIGRGQISSLDDQHNLDTTSIN